MASFEVISRPKCFIVRSKCISCGVGRTSRNVTAKEAQESWQFHHRYLKCRDCLAVEKAAERAEKAAERAARKVAEEAMETVKNHC